MKCLSSICQAFLKHIFIVSQVFFKHLSSVFHASRVIFFATFKHNALVKDTVIYLYILNKLKSLKVAQSKDDDGCGVVNACMNGCVSDVMCDAVCQIVCDILCDVMFDVVCDVVCDVLCGGVGDVVWDGVRDAVCVVMSGLVDVGEVEWLILCCFGVLIYDEQTIEQNLYF